MSKRLLTAFNWIVVIILCVAAGLTTFGPTNLLATQDWTSLVPRLFLVLIFSISFIGLKQWQQRWSIRTYHRCLWGLAGLILVMQLGVAISFVDVSRADAFWIRNQAIALAQGQHVWTAYFETYSNNVNFTLLVATALKGTMWFGLRDPWLLFNIGRFIWIDTGLVAGLIILRHWHCWRPGALGLLIGWAISVPLYAYALFDYTDALVLPAVVDCLALGLIFKKQAGWSHWLIAGVTWLLLALMMVMKPNLIVLWLAVGGIVLAVMSQRKIKWRTGLLWLMGSVLTLGLMFGGMQQLGKRYGYRPDPNQAVPATSWIAMSLNPRTSGQYDYQDFTVIRDQPTAKAKQRQASKLIKSRLEQLKFGGLLVHLAKKFGVFWGSGDFDSFKLTTQWLKAPNWYRVHTQATQFWLATVTQAWVLCLLIGSIGTLLRRSSQELSVNLLTLTILGFTLFHVGLWEAEARYALPLLPVLMLLATAYWSQLGPIRLTTRLRRELSVGLILATLMSGWQIWRTSLRQSSSTSRISRQGNGSYFETTSQVIQPQQQLCFKLPAQPEHNQLRLSPSSRSGRIRLQVYGQKHLLVDQIGSPNQLQQVTYKTTAQPLTVRITNVSQSPVAYAAIKANYSQLSGKILPEAAWYPEVTVRQQHRSQPLTSFGVIVSVLSVIGFFGLIITWLLI